MRTTFFRRRSPPGPRALRRGVEARPAAEPCPVPVLAVADPLWSYQGIARLHRRRFPELTVAAVTGSVGKTSVKEMLRAIFTAAAGAERVLYTVGNTNNQVGVPQNLLRLQPQHPVRGHRDGDQPSRGD